MARTFTLIKTETLSSDSATFTFSNIPQNFSHLLVKISTRASSGTGTSRALQMIINRDETNQVGTPGFDKYRERFFRVNDSGVADAGAFTSTSNLRYYFYGLPVNGTASAFGTSEIFIANYNKNSYKTIHAESFAEGLVVPFTGTAGMSITAALWFSPQAVTNLTFNSDQGNLVSGSTFYLYGIDSARATGGTITHDSEYTYHTFTSTGTFSALEKINNVNYLVVAGGGGGGGQLGGGGGAGGLRSTVTATGGGGSIESALALTAGTSYTVTIGAGGAGATSNVTGTNGSNSVFSTITSTGGGGGGSNQTPAEGVGNSGGSGGGNGEGTLTTNTGTANQGYKGGSAYDAGVSYGSGGGGGAGAVGANGTSTNGGNGGTGVAVAITGSSVTYAGGGGGSIQNTGTAGTGGAGGGGNGGLYNSNNGTAGTANTGGGGGGMSGPSIAAPAGGSGIVIIRYKTNE